MINLKDILQTLSEDGKSFVINLGDKVLRFTIDEIPKTEQESSQQVDNTFR